MEQNREEHEIMVSSADGGEAQTVIELGSIDSQRLLAEGESLPRKSSLSSRQMEALAALCDTFLPSVNVCDATDESTAVFLQTSASMAGTPQAVAELITEKLKHPKMFLLRWTLLLLSTWIGTFLLCGRASLSTNFPYFQKFSRVSLKKREEIVTSWSDSFLFLYRILFLCLKMIIPLVFFTQVDEKNDNLSWKAIGYCGADPDFKPRSRKTKFSESVPSLTWEEPERENGDVTEDLFFGPLYRGLIYPNNPRNVFSETLRRLGFPARVPHRKSKTTSPDSANPSLVVHCDAVVVGSGSGGGVVAGVLAKVGYRVLVLEKGNYYARSNLNLLEGPTMERMYMGNGLLATDDMGAVILAGATVGGGSAVNWSASIRTPKHVRREWSEKYGLELFESELYNEALDVVCERMGVQSEVENEGFNNAILRKGCQELGYPVSTIPRNSPADHYCGWCCLGCKDGRKKGTAETWLVDLISSGNGAILPRCEAIKVLTKQRKNRGRRIATGVLFEVNYKGVKEICVVKSKITIVACGALCTPSLLKRSGLKNPNIGKNLHLHPVAMAWGYFPDSPEAWPEAEKRSYEGGIMTAMSTVVGNFEKSGYGAVIQTPALHPGMFSALTPWISGADTKTRMLKFSRTAHIFALARDIGSGNISSPSSISYNMDQMDEENLKKGLEKILRILAAAGAEEIGTHHRNGKKLNVKKVSSREFERFVKEESSRGVRRWAMPVCSAHQMGSCRMGVDRRVSAVGPAGETWEVEGLYVADASVFPTALGVNPMVTVMATAYCTAHSVLELLRRRRRDKL
ncbi:Long-chain-alcohol oxidase [Bertholletia excelsa]